MHKKTHRMVKDPQISVGRLADYMAASEQVKRTIARSCKYQPIARVVQYNEALRVAGGHMSKRETAPLGETLERMRARIFDDEFDARLNEHNCDCVARFIQIESEILLPKADVRPTREFVPLVLNGTKVTFSPHFLLYRRTRTNKVKLGAAMIRYRKGRKLEPDIASYQSAFVNGYVERRPFEEAGEPEKALCLTIDCHTGVVHPAPGNSAYMFKEMAAACAGLAERWPAIQPPADAVL